MDRFKKLQNQDIGWGGIKCPCCKPKDLKASRRRARARMKADLRRELKGTEGIEPPDLLMPRHQVLYH